MIMASQIAPLRTASVDFETERLKTKFAQLRVERYLFFLTATEFDEILRWKLREQYERQRTLRATNSDERITTGMHRIFHHVVLPHRPVRSSRGFTLYERDS